MMLMSTKASLRKTDKLSTVRSLTEMFVASYRTIHRLLTEQLYNYVKGLFYLQIICWLI